MVDISKYKDINGFINFEAYYNAQMEEGIICFQCRNYISGSIGKCKQLCKECERLDTDIDIKVCHSKFIRCPFCGYKDSISQWANYNNNDIHLDGEHEIVCCECDSEFIINTCITYEYESPPMQKKDWLDEYLNILHRTLELKMEK